MKASQQVVPVRTEGAECPVHVFGGPVSADQGPCLFLIDHAVGLPFVFESILHVGKQEDQFLCLPGKEAEPDLKCGAGRPAGGDGPAAPSLTDGQGRSRALIGSYKALSVAVKALHSAVYGEDSVHVPSFSVLRFVVDGCVVQAGVIGYGGLFRLFQAADLIAQIGFYLHFARGKIPLEVLLVIVRIPQAPFHIWKYLNFPGAFPLVGQAKAHDLAGILQGNEGQKVAGKTVLSAFKYGIAHAVAAFIGVQLCFGRLPAGIPDGVPVLYIDIFAVAVIGLVVIAVSGDPEELRILIKGIASAGIGNQAEKISVSQVVDPGQRRPGRRNDIFASVVIKISEFHTGPLPDHG